jgi:hypothetical protein
LPPHSQTHQQALQTCEVNAVLKAIFEQDHHVSIKSTWEKAELTAKFLFAHETAAAQSNQTTCPITLTEISDQTLTSTKGKSSSSPACPSQTSMPSWNHPLNTPDTNWQPTNITDFKWKQLDRQQRKDLDLPVQLQQLQLPDVHLQVFFFK